MMSASARAAIATGPRRIAGWPTSVAVEVSKGWATSIWSRRYSSLAGSPLPARISLSLPTPAATNDRSAGLSREAT